MKVLTIKQPFATLIAEELKEYEFRTWKTKYRGVFLIHAGKSIDEKAMKKFEQYHLEYPTGCIIEKATLTDCIKIDDNVRKELQSKNPLVYARAINDIYWDGYGFKLENVEKIEPIPVSGKLSFGEYKMEE